MDSTLKKRLELSLKLMSKIDIPEEYKNYKKPKREPGKFEKGDLVKYFGREYTYSICHVGTNSYTLSKSILGRFDTVRIRYNIGSIKLEEGLTKTDILREKLLIYLKKGGIAIMKNNEGKYVPVIWNKETAARRTFFPISSSVVVTDLTTGNLLSAYVNHFYREDRIRIPKTQKELKEILKGVSLECLNAGAIQAIELVKRVYPNAITGSISEIKPCKKLNGASHVAIIIFDTVKLTNSKGEKYTHDGVGCIFYFKPSGALASDMMGTRTLLDLVEQKHNHSHSHMHQEGAKGSFGNWCFGGTDLSQLMSLCRTGFKPVLFESILYRLPDYLNWESLEGGPYRKIRNLEQNSGESARKDFIRDSSIISNMIPIINRLKLKFIENGLDSSYIIDRDSLENEIELKKAFILRYGPEAGLKSYITTKCISTNDYIDSKEEDRNALQKEVDNLNKIYSTKTPLFYNNGEPVRTRIKDIPKSNSETLHIDPNDLVKVLHRESFLNICRYLDLELKNYLLLNTIIKDYYVKTEEETTTTVS